MFPSSIFAAAAASTLWAAAAQKFGALAGIGLDYLTILTPVAVLSFQLGARDASPQWTSSGVVCVFGALFGLALFLWSVRIPLERTPPMPGPVRWSFIIFVVALLVVGGRLVLQVPNSIPWTITPKLSVVMGWMFLGAAVYFVYGLLRPGWFNTAGQWMGFLAYDVVLIVPFLTRLPTATLENQTGLAIYTVAVLYSGLLAACYLFFHKPTRLWS